MSLKYIQLKITAKNKPFMTIKQKNEYFDKAPIVGPHINMVFINANKYSTVSRVAIMSKFLRLHRVLLLHQDLNYKNSIE